MFEALLEFVEDHVEELLRVLLNDHVDGIAAVVFEGETEVDWVEVDAVTQLQVGEHPLELVENVVVHGYRAFVVRLAHEVLWFFIVSG